ncbi:MAG TPA: BON domain-containing protein [Vicinamibacterales bacterium]|nr:BON domain-containing protein [Vicinamibacterales bacterium]
MKPTRILVLLTSAVLVWSAAAPARAQNADRRDIGIAADISRQVDRYPQLTIFDYVSGTVDNGVVTLTGKVTMPFKKTDIGRKASQVTGVKEVINNIDVLPVSSYDEELRLRIARAIYGNSAFWQYGARANPPIHIIVEHGHVTLTGVVNSNVDRMLARSLATGFGELSVTNDLRTDAEMRSEP